MSDSFDPAAGLVEACGGLMRFWIARVEAVEKGDAEPLSRDEWAYLSDDLQLVRGMTLTIRGRA